MMLSVCSAFPTSSSSHFQLSFRAGSRAFYPLQKAIEDGRIIDDRPFCSQDGIHAQDISFKTHATRLTHSLVIEQPDKSGSSDSSIFSPYPNDFDEIVRGLPNEFSDNHPENLTCSVIDGNGLHSFTGDLKYMGSSDTLLNGKAAGDITNEVIRENIYADLLTSSDVGFPSNTSVGVTLQNLSQSSSQDPDTLYDSTSSGSLLLTDGARITSRQTLMEISNTVELGSKGSLNIKEGIGDFVSGLTKSVDKSISTTQSAVKSSYTSFVSSYEDAVKSVTVSFDNTIRSLFSSAGNSRQQATGEFSSFSNKIKENVYQTGTLATDILRRAVIIVEDSLSNAANFVVYSYGTAKTLLPPDLKNAINISEEKTVEILRPVGDAFHQIYVIIESFERNAGLDPSDPIVPFLLIVGSSATVGISYWLFTYGGYSGDFSPEQTLELLKNDPNAVLIDVRPEDSRQKEGVPDLRRAARSKYASFTLPELDGSLRKLLRSGKDLDNALTAVVIRNLKLVKNGSKIIVMDSNGDQSKAIARSLKKLGSKSAFLVQGGFRSWVRKGLRVKELKPETALTVLNDEAEAFLEDIKPTPTLVIGYGLGFLAACFALIEWETTLQFIGVIGIGQTLYRRFSSYEDSQDFNQDVRLLLTPVSLGAQAVSWAAGKLEPNKIGLPTSPSSTAVQDRVLKAAAKHESQPSEAADSQGLPSETSSQTKENLDLSEA